MKKILISSYAVSPIRGSECAVGWEITTRLAIYYDVTVLMCDVTPLGHKYFEEVQAFIKNKEHICNIKFVPVTMPLSSKKYTKLHDLGFWPAYYWGYKCWQKEAYRVANDLHKSSKFDLTYHLNMIGFREPGFLWELDIPFIWGPTNGFHSIPFSFLKSFKGKEFFFQTLKHAANELQIKLAFRAKKAARKAKLVWCVDNAAQNNLRKWGATTALLQETGLSVSLQPFNVNNYYDGIRTLNLIWSGMITSGKALHILIEALIEVKDINFHLTVLGDGLLLKQTKELAQPITNKITWAGWVTKEQAIKKVQKADLLVHTSLKEGTPHSILEAIGLGIPVVCHNTCGMGIVVDNYNGFKIPYSNNQTSIDYIVKILNEIVVEPEILNSRFRTIWSTTEGLTWDNKVQTMAENIDDILNNKSS
jgi:glycosyltransferase involved in cell wall biosynthesis